jgi:homocysteine S-methyltransferase
MAREVPEVVAVGVNCCDPADVAPAMALAAAAGLAGVAYPNSGEVWDGRAKRWLVSRGYFLQFTDTFDR